MYRKVVGLLSVDLTVDSFKKLKYRPALPFADLSLELCSVSSLNPFSVGC